MEHVTIELAPVNPDWWRTAAIYQIYPRSFADGNGDGLGDLPGVTSRVDYLASLGIDAVWLSPFYPSALADGGYDVDDYRDVDPRLGTLDDFDAMVAALHAAGIKVIVDIVPNHTSNLHAWFVEALASAPGSAARARYIFRDGIGDAAPNDWQSEFGGSAWERVPDGQWYFHTFAVEQPDLNWDNPEVRADFETTLRFWSDRGVDGFRVDVAHGLVKDWTTPETPWVELAPAQRPDGSHPYRDRDGVHEIYRAWRRVFNEYDPPRFAVAEAAVVASRRAAYAAVDGLGQAFNFEMHDVGWDASEMRAVIDSGLRDITMTGSSTWLLGCHDSCRVASRFGVPRETGENPHQAARRWLLSDGRLPCDLAAGTRHAVAAAFIELALPGSAYLYQGDELGLPEVPDLPVEWLADPMFARSPGTEKGRDGCRVPLPWTTDAPSFGFGPVQSTPPQPTWFGRHAVSVQDDDPASVLARFRTALAARRALVGPDLAFTWVDSAPEVLHFVRPGGWHCVANFGETPVDVPNGRVVASSGDLVDGLLPEGTTVWVVGEV